MRHLWITLYAKQGPDRLFHVAKIGPNEVVRIDIVVSGDGLAETSDLIRHGRRHVATRPDSWSPW